MITENHGATPPLRDAAARDAIINDLDSNLVVEAAAGTGKTTCLVGRLLNLCQGGAVSGDQRLAAVTFTLKAAAELRERLQKKLAEHSTLPDLKPEARRHLRQAAANLADCHIGTIHSFCARLLRERPVEAGISPDFRELEEDEDLLLRQRAWEEFSRQLHTAGGRDLRNTFELFGLDLDTLGQGFAKFAEYPDISRWPGEDGDLGQIDTLAFVKGVELFQAGLARFKPLLDNADCGTDKLLPILQVLDRRWPRIPQPPDLSIAYELSRLFRAVESPVQKQWKQFNLSGPEAKDEVEAYKAFREHIVKPFQDSCLAAVYGRALLAFHRARDIYDRLRRENGVLNFQDLLMAAAALLREYPEVREDLAHRYTRLLVDEVQDTDPVQAELMFLLASSDSRQRDWRKCTPRPGALFIVGDPKQSIYRFRRADIVVYQEIKRRIVAGGGRVLGLSSNFRSQPEILNWVNDTYHFRDGDERTPEAVALGGRFSDDECDYSPAYVSLEPGLPEAGAESFHGVYYLEAANKKSGGTDVDVVRDEARRIAVFIRDAIDREMPIAAPGGSHPAQPGDFLIITYKKKHGSVYADALRRLGVDCQVSSGGTLAESAELNMLETYLAALAQPDDGVQLLAVLRGGLFGISDAELYRWKKAGMTFSFLAPLKNAPFGPVAAAMTFMRKHHAALHAANPSAALPGVVDDLGLWALAGVGDDAARRVGVIATAMELLSAERAVVPTLGRLVERLRWHRKHYEADPLPATGRSEHAVRIMNLHKTKGLEAPVVFLACTRGMRKREAGFAVRRDGDATLGGMCISGGGKYTVVLARPREWATLAEREDLFLAAERTRLNYVAATRAGAALVVTVHKASGVWKSAFLPEFLPGTTIADKLVEPDAETVERRSAGLVVTPGINRNALGAGERERGERRGVMLRESYRVERAKDGGAWFGGGGEETGMFTGGGGDALAAESALDYGEVLHALLEGERGKDDLRGAAAALLREYGLPAAHLDEVVELVEVVRGSAIWRRASEAELAYREAPFAVRTEEGGGLLRGVIDLVFREEGEWVVVDYKSDRIGDGVDIVAAARRHEAQLRAYAGAWEKLTGERVREYGVFFIRRGEFIPITHG